MLGYLEAHIEQGPVLEALGVPVGVVEAIAGQSRFWAEVRGRAGHAGTPPMDGAARCAGGGGGARAGGRTAGRSVDGLRATVGTIAVEPGASNVVPGTARLSLDVRHADDRGPDGGGGRFRARATALGAAGAWNSVVAQ